MGKKMRLKIEELEVQSFVTSVDDLNKVKGGETAVFCTPLSVCGHTIEATLCPSCYITDCGCNTAGGLPACDPGGGGGGTPPYFEQH